LPKCALNLISTRKIRYPTSPPSSSTRKPVPAPIGLPSALVLCHFCC